MRLLSHDEDAFGGLDMKVFSDDFAIRNLLVARVGIANDFDVAGVGGGEEDGMEHGGYEAEWESMVQHSFIVAFGDLFEPPT